MNLRPYNEYSARLRAVVLIVACALAGYDLYLIAKVFG